MGKSSELDQTVKRFLLDSIDRDYCEPATDDTGDVIASLRRAFYDEYGWRVDQVGEQMALRDWLQGLPSAISIPFYNHAILELAVKWGSLPDNATEKQEDKILDNYWNFMANKIGQLFRGYHLPKGN